VAGDRLPQGRQPHRQIARPAEDLGERGRVDPQRLPIQDLGRRQVRAEELDRPAGALDEAPIDRVAAEGARRVLAEARREGAPRGPARRSASARSDGSRVPGGISPRSMAARIASASRW
jgi:hypothetical protein